MTSEDKVLAEIKENVRLLFQQIEQLRVTEAEREKFRKETETFYARLVDYKLHKKQFEEKVAKWNSQHQ